MLLQNKVDGAKAALDQAAKASANNPIVNNNLGIWSRWTGDRDGAKELYNAASGAGSEVSYNMAIISIMEGDYAGATSNVGSMVGKSSHWVFTHTINIKPYAMPIR